MLTHGILNSQLAAALAKLRHKDQFVISDCGLPVPQGVEVIDLALVFGIPRFSDVLNAIKADPTKLVTDADVENAQNLAKNLSEALKVITKTSNLTVNNKGRYVGNITGSTEEEIKNERKKVRD